MEAKRTRRNRCLTIVPVPNVSHKLVTNNSRPRVCPKGVGGLNRIPVRGDVPGRTPSPSLLPMKLPRSVLAGALFGGAVSC